LFDPLSILLSCVRATKSEGGGVGSKVLQIETDKKLNRQKPKMLSVNFTSLKTKKVFITVFHYLKLFTIIVEKTLHTHTNPNKSKHRIFRKWAIERRSLV
jgi:hypothetical protein